MKRCTSLPVLPLAVALGLLSLGCSGFGDSILYPGGSKPTAAGEAPAADPMVESTEQLVATADAQQFEALTVALDRLNDTQARLQITLQDMQKDALAQAEVARRDAIELQSSRRSTLIAGIAAAAALLIALLLAVIVVRQSGQVRRAVRALAEAEADAQEELEGAVGGAGQDQAAGAGRRLVREGAAGSASAARSAEPGAGGPTAPGAPIIARLRKRPPVG